MKTIKIQKLIEGYKIGEEFAGKDLVAIKVKWRDIFGKDHELDHPVKLVIGSDYMDILDWKYQAIELSNPFKDKYRRDNVSSYVLGYFEWRPTMIPQQVALF